ncbi:hypothetical protein NLI96_g7099 [Meripilus lineatus]|uniref:J domain-containing protein n=1 Tax=Meripilus lineatus TaxID=2056292 RepID=A0AAD5UZP1_9APHY|nr:hypothetical protein NLI96_g7099 [Physisporinus lineatus]
MANYNYDEAGNMAAYFLLTFLLLVLVPFSLPSSSSKQQSLSGCDCQECVQHRSKMRKLERGSLLMPKLSKRSLSLLVGWSLFAFVAFKVATTEVHNKVYDPFEILGLKTGVSVKEIKSHYKKLSRVFHPDKVKLTANQTMDMVEAKFVEITKAYKALTDETIRRNFELYGHPDGRQEVSMGIALPKWIVEGKNNIWVLGFYGIIFGAALPGLVGRWWFGNRQKTKDGVNARSAATFFKSLSEESDIAEVLTSLGKSYEWERPVVSGQDNEVRELEQLIKEQLGDKWTSFVKVIQTTSDTQSEIRHRSLVLLFSHLLRLPVASSTLAKEQSELLLQTPVLLNSLLNVSTSRNWLTPTLGAMRLHAYITQALYPGQTTSKFAQLPGIKQSEAEEFAKESDGYEDLTISLEEKHDGRLSDIKKAITRWGKLDLVDASFKVIGDRLVTPSSFVYLLIKARLVPPVSSNPVAKVSEDAANNEQRENEFLNSRKEVEELADEQGSGSWVHAPYWPSSRKPTWWAVLADPKTNRIVVPPMKIADVPYADSEHPDTYRSYKLQFQAPPQIQVLPWKLYLISDSFIGEEVTTDLVLKIEDPSVLDLDQTLEDEISDPEEDSLAGQMAMMRGGSVKRRQDEESDDESTTDDDQSEHGDDSSSDSD